MRINMKKPLAVAVMILFISISVIPSTGTNILKKSTMPILDGNTLYVGGTGAGNYTHIQDAIDDASAGDTVYVYDDSSPYFENIVVDKSINLTGENRDTTVIYGDWESDSVVYISADCVNISEFTIHYGNEEYFCGIKLDSCNNNISGNFLTDNWCGIFLSDSSNGNTITGNIINGNGYPLYGIYLSDSNNGNIIKNNTFSYNYFALYLSDSSNNNIITDNYFLINNHGIILDDYCMNNTIARNTLIDTSCCTCIGLSSSDSNIIIDNLITMYSYWGDSIYICDSKDNIVIGNSISNCGNGIVLRDYSSNNIILCNNIINCARYGVESCHYPPLSSKEFEIHLNYSRCSNINGKNIQNDYYGIQHFMSSGDNSIHHNNFINNTQNAYDEYSNEWDNGYPSGGNFWDDYNGTDADDDGIGDTPYNISGGDNQDRYPLIEPWGDNPMPIAKFTWTPPLPEPNETITFNASESIDYDGIITLYEWDWDNDGEYDENHTNPTATHTFEEVGYYPVTLKVTDNASLTGMKTKTVRVGNQPPYEPSNPFPEDGAHNVPITGVILSWNCSDPDPGDTLRYCVYFERDDPTPNLVSNNQTGTTYNPGDLESYNTYYWKIVAWDNHGASTAGPVWHFSTNVTPVPPPPTIDGPQRGIVGIEYEYTFSVKDNGCNNVSIYIVWGDGQTNWTAFVEPGIEIKLNHTWYKKGDYIIMAKAKDIYGLVGPWETLSVTMPLNLQSSQGSSQQIYQQSANQLFLRLSERYGFQMNVPFFDLSLIIKLGWIK
jgi:parallel beta-helix repeat protein